MPEAIWIDQSEDLAALGQTLAATTAAGAAIGLDTEFLRERTFFPRLCVLQVAASGRIWCVDTLRVGSLEPLLAPLTALNSRKILHSARQDLEALYLHLKRVISPLFDTQIAAGCIGLKPQIGYADLVKTLLDVTLPKGQTRTDWSKRPLSRAQLEYAADDVLYLEEVATRLDERLRALGRERWVQEDCAALEDTRLYEPDPAQAWKRLKGVRGLPALPRARARALAVWREKLARARDLPRGWIIPDAAIFRLAELHPATRAGLAAVSELTGTLDDATAEGLLESLRETSPDAADDALPDLEVRPTPEQKAAIDRLARTVDARAAELGVSAEILAPRGELKALVMGAQATSALNGWRRAEIGEKLLEALA